MPAIAAAAAASATKTAGRNPFSRAWGAYSRSLRSRPIGTKVAAAVTIFTASDLAAQCLAWDAVDEARGAHSSRSRRTRDDENDERESQWRTLTRITTTAPALDYGRAASASAFGVVGTVYLHYWWNALEAIVSTRFRGSSRVANTAIKVAIDQVVSAPVYNWCYFFVTNYVHASIGDEGEAGQVEEGIAGAVGRARTAASKANDMICPLMLQHWKIWPSVHFLNFYFNPVQNRVLVQNLAVVGWSGYLSHLNHSSGVTATASRVEGANAQVDMLVRRHETMRAAGRPK